MEHDDAKLHGLAVFASANSRQPRSNPRGQDATCDVRERFTDERREFPPVVEDGIRQYGICLARKTMAVAPCGILVAVGHDIVSIRDAALYGLRRRPRKARHRFPVVDR